MLFLPKTHYLLVLLAFLNDFALQLAQNLSLIQFLPFIDQFQLAAVGFKNQKRSFSISKPFLIYQYFNWPIQLLMT